MASSEYEPLLIDHTPAERFTGKKLTLLIGAVVATSALLGLHYQTSDVKKVNKDEQQSPLFSIEDSESISSISSEESLGPNDWIFKKVTHLCHSSEISDTFSFLKTYLMAEVEPAANLGCGSTRIKLSMSLPTIDNNGNNDIHDGAVQFVEAPIFNDLMVEGKTSEQQGADYWIHYWKKLHNDMTEFNGFMHNKLQLYTPDLSPFVIPMIEDEIPLMIRSSVDSEGIDVGHVSLQVQGVIFELVGPLSSLPSSMSTEEETSSTVLVWDEDHECPEAHFLTTSLSVLDKLARPEMDTTTSSSSSYDESLQLDSSRPRLLLHTLSMSNSNPTSSSAKHRYEQAHYITGASTSLTHVSDTCSVVDMVWSNQPYLTIRYVDNKAAYTGTKTLKDYDEYVALDHDTFLFVNGNTAVAAEDITIPTSTDSSSSTSNSASWDRYLDQHIGLWYSGNDETECNIRAASLRSALETDVIGYAERAENDAHLIYAGYNGPMAFEYQFASCDGGVTNAPAEDGCVATNAAAVTV